jgi:hypothetical protein
VGNKNFGQIAQTNLAQTPQIASKSGFALAKAMQMLSKCRGQGEEYQRLRPYRGNPVMQRQCRGIERALIVLRFLEF